MGSVRVAERWHEYGGAVTSLIGHLGTSWSDRHAARRTQYAFERLVLQYDDLAAPRRLAVTLGLRVQLRAPRALTLPAGIDRLYVYLCDGARVLVATSCSIGASIARVSNVCTPRARAREGAAREDPLSRNARRRGSADHSGWRT